jgi:hypothetical protein
MVDQAQLLSNPVAALVLRVALGGYVIYMARKFYADPTGYFRKTARNVVDLRTLEPIVRGLACFCLWGGCFIVATAIAVGVFGLHGDLLALALVSVAGIATWLLLPKQQEADL